MELWERRAIIKLLTEAHASIKAGQSRENVSECRLVQSEGGGKILAAISVLETELPSTEGTKP